MLASEAKNTIYCALLVLIITGKWTRQYIAHSNECSLSVLLMSVLLMNIPLMRHNSTALPPTVKILFFFANYFKL